MATLTHAYRHSYTHSALNIKRDEFIEKLIPRRCMVLSTGLIFAGMSIPMLMAVKILPVSLLFGFAGFALVVTGGVLALILCGEI
jgi:hypothetical protein